MARAAQQHFAAVVEPFAQHLGEPDHPRDAALHQHIHVEGNAALELGELEQGFHQQRRIDRARAGLEHEAHVLGRFVAHVGEQRQFSLVEQLGDALDQPRFLHQPRDLGDDDHVGAPPGLLPFPARPHPE